MMTREENLWLSCRLAQMVGEAGGTAYFVGGYVRDLLRGEENKDIDIEIHGLPPAALEAILDRLGDRLSIGESFGIYSLRHSGIDIALPRKEKLIGKGHRDFEVFVDPFIGTRNAAVRRDFTVNALMRNILTGEIIDHFGGLKDLNAGVLRHVNDETFPEDPLRVFRAAQFAARFGYTVDKNTVALCKTLPVSALSRERVAGELNKALLKAEKPSVFFEVLNACGQLDFWFPEVKALIGVPQNPEFHMEGDVWTHTMLVLDEAAKLRHKARQPLYFMLSALVHDFGKPLCTEMINGKLHAYGHEEAGLAPAETFLRRLTDEKKLISYVQNMTKLHMRPNVLAFHRSAIKKTNVLFDASVEPSDLILLAFADDHGRVSPYIQDDAAAFLEERLTVYRKLSATPQVTGADLIAAGLRPDRSFSELLSYARKLRLSGLDHDSALKQTLKFAEKMNK